MPTLINPLENPGQSRSPGLAAALAMFAGGLVAGLGMAADLGGQFHIPKLHGSFSSRSREDK